jgi:hypothetical protein
MIGRGSRHPTRVKLSTDGVFSRCFVAWQAHSRPPVLEPHINRRGFGQGCAFGSLIDTSHLIGELSPKTLILGTSIGISSLNVYGRISTCTDEIYHNALWLKMLISTGYTMCNRKSRLWGHFRGQIYSFLQNSIQSSNGISS